MERARIEEPRWCHRQALDSSQGCNHELGVVVFVPRVCFRTPRRLSLDLFALSCDSTRGW